jgi:hypothetical protein
LYSIAGRSCGWDRLTQKFGASIEPQGTQLRGQTIKVGAVRWKNCVSTVLSPQGMYLNLTTGPTALLGRLAPVLIPWGEFKNPRPGWLYVGWQAIEMSVGEPEIVTLTFRSTLFQQMTAYINTPHRGA